MEAEEEQILFGQKFIFGDELNFLLPRRKQHCLLSLTPGVTKSTFLGFSLLLFLAIRSG